MNEADAAEQAEWLADFEAAARRPLKNNLENGFVRTYKPVMDDKPSRSFETMAEYRHWCNTQLPWWLGYATDDPPRT